MEIEHKFLVNDIGFLADATTSFRISQGYLSESSPTLRIRIAGQRAFLTVKSSSIDGGLSRHEWEYEIPVEEARQMLPLCKGHVIEKTRYIVPYKDKTWEVDIFHGRYEGLAVAELEVVRADEYFDLPPWAGTEVTGDKRYYNAYMAKYNDTPIPLKINIDK
ncbi:adenylate cyclase [Porphyromonas macacae]|uniref:Adenylate cyclase n=1 Tax=Porphyromonas macacae TaxID=28115 RepID=A0A0A2E6H4_9PORP|nr:CYTH domain-containing protein [Porphyromonas macacae]KGN74456.1 adenylate cyclase [Porphyromonas macacae]